MKYGIKIVALKTEYGRINPDLIGRWAHVMFGVGDWIFGVEEAAKDKLHRQDQLNIIDFDWAVAPITRADCAKFREFRETLKQRRRAQ